MQYNTPHIHLFKTPGGYYIYDVNRNTIIRTEKSTYKKLISNSSDLSPVENDEDIRELLGRGYLSSNRVEEIEHHATGMLGFYLENKVSALTLQVTQQCNLRCEYCVYSGGYHNRGHANNRMSRETALKAIDFLFTHSKDAKRLNIGFYGGEPLLEFKLIKECMEYAVKKSEGRLLTFGITTNGTLLNDEIADFFEKHDVAVLISLDGPKEIHDKNRKQNISGCGSFDTIMENLGRLREKHPGYMKKVSFSVVVDPTSNYTCVDKFFTGYELVKDSKKVSSLISKRYAKNETAAQDSFIKERNYEVFKVYLHKLGRLDVNHTSALAVDEYNRLKNLHDTVLIPAKSLSRKEHHGGPCIPGVNRFFVNAKGDFYPCERVSETSDMMKIGSVDTGFDLESVDRILNIGRLSKENCRNCWAFRLCYMCVAMADDLTQLSGEKKVSNCGNVRRSTEQQLKNYCTLREFGHVF